MVTAAAPTLSPPKLHATDLDERIATLTRKRNELVHSILSLDDSRPPLTCQTTSLGTPSTHPEDASGGSLEESTGSRSAPSEEQIASALATAKRSRAEHIRLLMRYNDVKDVAQGLMGMIAESRGCRVVDVMEEFGAEVDD